MAVFRAILNDIDEAFYDSNTERYRDKRLELVAHIEAGQHDNQLQQQ